MGNAHIATSEADDREPTPEEEGKDPAVEGSALIEATGKVLNVLSHLSPRDSGSDVDSICSLPSPYPHTHQYRKRASGAFLSHPEASNAGCADHYDRCSNEGQRRAPHVGSPASKTIDTNGCC